MTFTKLAVIALIAVIVILGVFLRGVNKHLQGDPDEQE